MNRHWSKIIKASENDLAGTYVAIYPSGYPTVANETDGTHRTRKRARDDPFSRFLDLEARVDDSDESEQQEE